MSRRRSILLAGLVLALVIVGLYGLLLRPQKEKEVARLKREASELEQAIGIAKLQADRVRTVLQRILQEGSPVYVSSGDWKGVSSRIFSGIDELVKKTGLVLVRMEPEAPEGSSPCIAHPLQLEVRGAFAGICSFMEGLERDLLLVPMSWTVEPMEKEEGTLKASMRVKANEWIGERLLAIKIPEITPREPNLSEKRDPFSRGLRRFSIVTEKTNPPALTGIMIIGGKAKAIIDGKPYGVGDLVRGKRIVSINEESVLLEGEKTPLVLERPIKRVGDGSGKRSTSMSRGR